VNLEAGLEWVSAEVPELCVAGKTWPGAGCGTTWRFTSGWRCGVFATLPPARLPAWFTASVPTSYQATHFEWLGGGKRTWILLASYAVARRAAPMHALRANTLTPTDLANGCSSSISTS